MADTVKHQVSVDGYIMDVEMQIKTKFPSHHRTFPTVQTVLEKHPSASVLSITRNYYIVFELFGIACSNGQ